MTDDLPPDPSVPKLDQDKLRESCKAHAESEELSALSERNREQPFGHYWSLAIAKQAESNRLMIEADPELHGPSKEVDDFLLRRDFVLNEETKAKMRPLRHRAEALVRLRCQGPTS